MIVQATNTGADLAQGQFDLAILGGGVGICNTQTHSNSPRSAIILTKRLLDNGCTDEWGAPAGGWGAQYGG